MRKLHIHLSASVKSKSHNVPLPLANCFIVPNDGAFTAVADAFSSNTKAFPLCFGPSPLPFEIHSRIFPFFSGNGTVSFVCFWAFFFFFFFFLHWTWPMHETLGEEGSFALKLVPPLCFLRASLGIIETGDRQGLRVGFWKATEATGCFGKNLKNLFLIWESFSMLGQSRILVL